MKKSCLGIFLVTVLTAAALISGGTLGADHPDAATEATSSAELLPELLNGSADSGPQGLVTAAGGADTDHFPQFTWHVSAPNFGLPSVPLCPTSIQPRSPPLRVHRPF
jgi:hypothetical protein